MFRLLLVLFSLNSFSQIDTKKVLTQLMGIHGTNWSTLIKTQEDRDSVKVTLNQIIQGQLELTQYGYDEYYTEDIRNNAISEYGHFVDTNSSGEMAASDADLFQGIINKNSSSLSSHESLSLYQGLKNAGTPGSLEKLSILLNETTDLATQYSLARSIQDQIQGVSQQHASKELDHSYIKPYTPNIKSSYQNRKGDWTQAIKIANNALNKSKENVLLKSRDENFKENFTGIVGNISSFTRVQTENNSGRAIASADIEADQTANDLQGIQGEVEREPSSESASFIQKYASYFLVFLFFVIAIVVNRKVFFS